MNILNQMDTQDNFFEKLKHLSEVSTTELLFDISPQTENQCPNIDSVLGNVKYAYKAGERGKDCEDIEDLKAYCEEVYDELYSVDSDMEDLRSAIVDIRAWGDSWKTLCKDLIYEFLKNDKEFIENYLGDEVLKELFKKEGE